MRKGQRQFRADFSLNDSAGESQRLGIEMYRVFQWKLNTKRKF